MKAEKLKKLIFEIIREEFSELVFDYDEIHIEKQQPARYGDLASNIALKLAKGLKKDAVSIAEIIYEKLEKNWPQESDFQLEPTVSGFLNFNYSKLFYSKKLAEIVKLGREYGKSDCLKSKKIQVEFISANPTGPLTLANGRGGFGGDVLANLFSYCGAKVEREYLINDGGNQVTILGQSVLAGAGLIRDSEEYYHGEYIDSWAKGNKEAIESKKDNPKKLGQLFAEEILEKEIKAAVKLMKINFDNWFSEKSLIKKGEVDKAIADFNNKKLTYQKDGALWFKTTEYGDDKDRVLVKEDGETTYFANDSAYHWDKFAKRKYDLVVNFWGADHHGYVSRMLATVAAMGFEGQLKIIIMQLVRLIKDGKEVRMSKRLGTYITIDELIGLIGGDKSEATDVARFFFLSRDFSTHMDFDLDLAKERSEKNPVYYVKYAHARTCALERKADGLRIPPVNYDLLGKKEELELLKELAEFPTMVEEIVNNQYYSVHQLIFYAQDLAAKFHYFYDQCQIIDPEDLEKTALRLEIVRAAQIVLKNLMVDLIGIKAPERM